MEEEGATISRDRLVSGFLTRETLPGASAAHRGGGLARRLAGAAIAVTFPGMLALGWTASASAEIKALTPTDIDGLSGPNITASQIEAVMKRQVLDAAPLAEEIEKEVGIEVVKIGGELVGGIFLKLPEAIEVASHCHTGASATSIADKNGQIAAAHDNVIALEPVLLSKLQAQYGQKAGYNAFRRFITSTPIAQFLQIKRKPREAPACKSAPKPGNGTQPTTGQAPPTGVPRTCLGFLKKAEEINGPVGKRQNYCIYQMCLRNGGLGASPEYTQCQ